MIADVRTPQNSFRNAFAYDRSDLVLIPLTEERLEIRSNRTLRKTRESAGFVITEKCNESQVRSSTQKPARVTLAPIRSNSKFSSKQPQTVG